MLEEPGHPTSMEGRQYKTTLAAATFGFNPAEKRDEHGKWTRGGSLVKKIEDLGSENTGAQQHFTKGSDLRGSHQRALARYGNRSYARVNEALRYAAEEGVSLRKVAGVDRDERSLIGDLDSAMKKAGGSKAETYVFRGVGGGLSRMFGRNWDKNGDNTGLEWRAPTFVSTSQSRDVAVRGFSGGAVMRIRVPAGTRGISLDSGVPGVQSHEEEVLLDRDLRFRIVKDHGWSPKGRLLDVEVVPGA